MFTVRHFGYFTETGPNPILKDGECDTSTCGHCGKITYLKPPPQGSIIVRTAAPCGGCRKLLCEECMGKMTAGHGCDPFEKKLERWESRERLISTVVG